MFVTYMKGRVKVAGIITFSECFQWNTKGAWILDSKEHLVSPNDPEFGWNPNQAKFGWRVESVRTSTCEYVHVGSRIKRSIVSIQTVVTPKL
mmetsp:Transcript_1867/g.2139  ORF Transcript_1867/g.2139 Transcript_1867/m.2139 type:complete len:92 (-) Transcript_1867:365-640(-)